ncbi:hypothetical protein [Burkholderia ubonensis]|uniref:hypothetical protein n=1 Tax=Burkholderia ubonensis TaxID=101571 RepID=UPI0007531213|nr:hypothetical protein [Burkholderia ubonensis]KVA75162.1 hypothetical protein WM36_10740 [Burkholderia ubonensis]KVP77566.1 hypothetical protein WJ94_00040 [Burkholderia ubonensis]KVR54719.1 hypothetical protein WK19_15150 [Burkholderia ubonensis]KVX38402.1 hypothetical protein WL04_11930 [Burkholderia ubonensis]KWD43722.1 hypothetical protein WL65_20380 [Burkholderia ubonensis]
MSDSILFERAALYDEVWADPVSTVSKRYGMSDNGLRKVCQKLGVPLPPLGYWAKLRAGQNVRRPQLPRHDGPTVFHAQPEANTYRVPGAAVETENRETIEQEEARPQNRILPTEPGEWRHRLIGALAKRLAEVDRQIAIENEPARNLRGQPRFHQVEFSVTKPGGVLDVGPGYAAVVVTPNVRRRALSIADAFFVAMEARGFKVRLTDTHTVIACKDIVMQFRLSEMTEKNGNSVGYDNWSPLGRLRITMRQSVYIGKDIRARDEADIAIEDQLNILAARLRIAVLGFDSRQEFRKEQALQHTEMMRRIEHAAWHDRTATEAAQREKLAVESLFMEADEWEACERRRRYVERVELLARDRGVDVSQASQLGQWLAWARASCDAHDPIFYRVSGANKEA